MYRVKPRYRVLHVFELPSLLIIYVLGRDLEFKSKTTLYKELIKNIDISYVTFLRKLGKLERYGFIETVNAGHRGIMSKTKMVKITEKGLKLAFIIRLLLSDFRLLLLH